MSNNEYYYYYYNPVVSSGMCSGSVVRLVLEHLTSVPVHLHSEGQVDLLSQLFSSACCFKIIVN